MKNKGKLFEQQIKDSSKHYNILCDRYPDTDLSYNGNSVSSFTHKSPYDYALFDGEIKYIIEAKSTSTTNIGVQLSENDSPKQVKYDQIKSLRKYADFNYRKLCVGFFFNFRDEDENGNIMDEHTYFMSIEDFDRFFEGSKKSSINQTDIMECGGIAIESILLRTNYRLNIKEFCEIMQQKVGV